MKKGLGAVSRIALLMGLLGVPNPARGDCTALAPNNECAPGGGSKKSDCQMEWRFTPVPKKYVDGIPIADVKRGRQRDRIICYEGDPRCDFDIDLGNHKCTFRTQIVINNADLNLPKCDPDAGVATFEVTRPTDVPFSIGSTDLVNLATLETQFSTDFGVPVIRDGILISNGTTNATANRAGTPMDLIVPLAVTSRGAFTTGVRRIRIRATNVLSQRDQDSLQLVCRPSTCGNHLIETDHETCDDGNRANGDGCNQGCHVEGPAGPTPTQTPTATPALTPTITHTPTITTTAAATTTATNTPTPGAGPPTAFRASTLTIADPHVWADPIGAGLCLDLTTTVNGLLSTPIQSDGDDPPDGILDLSILVVFRPLDQVGPGGTAEAYIAADCTAPVAGTSCTPGGATVQLVDYTNQAAGTCLTSVAGTTGGYSPAINTITAPCFVTDQLDVAFDFSGITISLQGGRVGGTYVGAPATSLSPGLLFGFLDEASADLVLLPASLPAPFGGAALSSLLAGGAGNCKTAMPRGPCISGCRDDRDLGPGGESGWYFYLNYAGTQVPFTE